ncbi:MAG: proprotein convertase P-domain-containing protein [Lewinellaceae bacterium]|nr:proprotein convertase P-domain-containing protein [Lewinellaceae bacterium]
MKKANTFRRISSVLLGMCLAVAGFAQTYSSAPGSFISSTNPNGITTDVINVPLTGTVGVNYVITDVTININHTWDSDLEIQLVGPGGTPITTNLGANAGENRIWLSENNGGSADNYVNTHFRDNATNCIAAGAAPFTGDFRAEGSNLETCNFGLAQAFSGFNVNGNWTLIVDDEVGGDDGTLVNWSITFAIPCSFPSPLPDLALGLDPGVCSSAAFNSPTSMGDCTGAVYTYSVNGGPEMPFTPGSPVDPNLPNGNYVITWKAVNGAGAVGTVTQNISVADDIPPVIVCPADINVTLAAGECAAYVNYPPVTASDNCPFIFQQQGFAGAYDPANWTIQAINSNGSVNTAGAPANVVINGSDNGSGGAGQENFNIILPQSGTIGFTWNYSTVDNAIFDPPGYMLNGVFTQLLATGVTGSGNVTIPVVAGDMFGFSQRTVDNIFGNGILTITNFNGPAGGGSPTVTQTQGLPSGSEFPLGTTTNCFETFDVAGNQATCCFDVTILEFPNPTTTLVCNDNVQVSLSEDCVDTLNADQILEGGPYGCYLTRYTVNLLSPTGGMLPGIVNASHIGKTITVKVTDVVTLNTCWGTIHVEDKLAPIIECRDITIPCTEDPNNPSDPDLLQPAPGITGPQTIIYDNLSDPLDLPAGQNLEQFYFFDYNLPAGTPALDVNVIIDLEHSFTGDVNVDVTAPDGTLATAFAVTGCGGFFPINCTFDDQGPAGVDCNDLDRNGDPLQCLNNPGVFNPMAMAAFNGKDASGVWQIRIWDDFPVLDGGTIFKVGLQVTVDLPAIPSLDNCSGVSLDYLDNVTNGACGGPSQTIIRTWTATDGSGNESTCQQEITLERPTLGDVDAPLDIKWTCDQYNKFPNIIEPTPLHPYITDTDTLTAIIDVNLDQDCDDDDLTNASGSKDHPSVNSTNTANGGNGCPGGVFTPYSNPGPNSGLDDADVLELTGSGIPTVDGLPLRAICGIGTEHEDLVVNICPGTFKIVRKWTLIDWCANPVQVREVNQVVKVADEKAPILKAVTQDTFHQVYTIGAAGPKVVNGANTTITVTQTSYNIGDTTQIFFLPNGNVDSWNVVEDVIQVPPAVKLKLRSFKFTTNIDIPVYSASIPANGGPHAVCQGNFQVPPAVDMGDNCSGTAGYTTEVWTLNGVQLASIPSNGGVVSGIPLYQNGLPAQYIVRYYAVDGCGNQAFYDITATLRDRVPPVAVCDEITEVSIINNGLNPGQSCSTLHAESLDDGSYDNCQPVYFLMAKMSDATATQTIFNRCYYPTRDFCCDDIGDQTVILLVLDSDPTPYFTTLNSPALGCDGTPGLFLNQTFGLGASGQPNYNTCMVTVQVTDKLPPVRTFCPPDKRITCDWFADNLETQLQGLTGAQQCAYLKDAGFGEATFYDNCAVNVTCNTTVNLDQCLEGVITRTWSATDNAGNAATQNCTSRIFVDHVSDWVVEFPADITVNCGTSAPDFGEPEIFYETCELVAVSYEDELFTIVQDACYKILRTWTIINWCVVGNNIDQEVVEQPENQLGLVFPLCDLDGDGDCDNRTFRDSWNSASKPGAAQATQTTNPDTDLDSDPWDGYITYQQVIKVNDTVDPVFVDCSNPDICIEDNSCDADVRPVVPTVDECSHKVTLTAQIRINGVWQNAGTVVLQDGQPVGQFTLFPNLKPGVYDIRYVAMDNCNNQSACETTVTVRDCKNPTPYCEDGLVIELMQTGMVQTWASDFDAGSFDNCPGALKFSFSTNPADSGRVYTCDSVGLRQVRIYVFDNASPNANFDYCITQVEIQANQNQCDDTLNVVQVGGNIATETALSVENVGISINGAGGGSQVSTTSGSGNYNFASVPLGNDYTVAPSYDADPLNGVSTFDLVLISKHILGVQPLGSPYRIIAADANKSNTVTTFDLVEIRKLILFINTDFPNNTSWRFVGKNFVFPNPSNPFQTGFPEVANLNNLASDQLAVDFVAVKIGDVNGSAVTNFGTGSEDRTVVGDLVLNTEDRTVAAGETCTVEFKATDFNVSGYQFTVGFDRGALEFVDVVPGLADVANFGTTMAGEGVLTTSWNGDEAKRLAAGEVVFGLTFKANRSGRLSDLISVNSRYTAAEAYSADNQLLNVALSFDGAKVAGGFELYQNTPNPFAASTAIGFYLPEATSATLTISDVQGKVLRVVEGDYTKGYHQVDLKRGELNASGVLYYRLDTGTDSATRKMILVD